MKHFFKIFLLPLLMLCSKNNNGVNNQSPADLAGSIWKISKANVKTITISENPLRIFDTTYLDTHKIAEVGTDFGYFNFMSFLSKDTMMFYSNIIQDKMKKPYLKTDTNITIEIRDTTVDTIEFVLEMKILSNNQLYLDYPWLSAIYYFSSSPSIGIGRIFKDLQDRNIFISTIDTTYHSDTMDSLVYSTYSYFYLRQ